MKIRTYYNRIDREVYEFDTNDIKDALETKAKLRYQPGKRVEFDYDIDEDGKITATLTVVWETPAQEVAA